MKITHSELKERGIGAFRVKRLYLRLRCDKCKETTAYREAFMSAAERIALGLEKENTMYCVACIYCNNRLLTSVAPWRTLAEADF